jgi:hypothetical protein
MNITLSADTETIQQTRKYAREHGTSVNQLVREFLAGLTGWKAGDEVAEEFERNATEHGGRSPKGYRFDRAQAQRRRSGT